MKPCAELLIASLQEKELHFQTFDDNDGDTAVLFPFAGKMVRMFFSGEEGEYFSLFLQYESVPEDKLADVIFVCNELNAGYKWVTFYVDKDNDIMLHDDAILSIENAAEEAFELLIRMINISKDAKQKIMRAIYA